MNIAILQCDVVLDNLQREFVSYSHMIQRMFFAIDNSFEIEIFNCQLNQYPDDIDAYDFFITTGSRVGAYEDVEWIQQLIKFIQLLDRQQK
ncbi:MAG: GMP synthase, partial [Gammaproteobacteria bacterium]